MAHVLTVEEAAEMLRLNPQVVRQYLRQQKLPGRKVGRHWLITEEELTDFLHSGEREAPELRAWNERARQWHKLPPEEKKRRLYAIAGKYAHIPFSSEDLMREHREEVEREEQRLRRAPQR